MGARDCFPLALQATPDPYRLNLQNMRLFNSTFLDSRHFQALFTKKVKNFSPLKSRLSRIATTDDSGIPRKTRD